MADGTSLTAVDKDEPRGGLLAGLCRVSRWVALALGIATLAPGCRKRDFSLPHHFAVVKPGVLLRSSLPSVKELTVLKKRYGIKTIVALLDWEDLKEYQEVEAARKFAAENGMNHVHMAMGFPESEQITRFLDIVTNPENQPVLVHCVHGEVRTGMMVAFFRMECEGWPNEEAYEEIWGAEPDVPGRDQLVAEFVHAYRSQAGYLGAGPINPHSGRSLRATCE